MALALRMGVMVRMGSVRREVIMGVLVLHRALCIRDESMDNVYAYLCDL